MLYLLSNGWFQQFFGRLILCIFCKIKVSSDQPKFLNISYFMSFFKNSVSSLVFFWLRIANRSFRDLAFWGCCKIDNEIRTVNTLFVICNLALQSWAVGALRAVGLVFGPFGAVGVSRHFLQLPSLSGPPLQLGSWSEKKISFRLLWSFERSVLTEIICI